MHGLRQLSLGTAMCAGLTTPKLGHTPFWAGSRTSGSHCNDCGTHQLGSHGLAHGHAEDMFIRGGVQAWSLQSLC